MELLDLARHKRQACDREDPGGPRAEAGRAGENPTASPTPRQFVLSGCPRRSPSQRARLRATKPLPHLGCRVYQLLLRARSEAGGSGSSSPAARHFATGFVRHRRAPTPAPGRRHGRDLRASAHAAGPGREAEEVRSDLKTKTVEGWAEERSRVSAHSCGDQASRLCARWGSVCVRRSERSSLRFARLPRVPSPRTLGQDEAALD